MNILSIQSHVSYGYVGNRCAQYVFETMGDEVYTINTVNLSSHSGYGSSTGIVFTKDDILNLVDGLLKIPKIHIDGIISGYIGSPDIAEAIFQIVQQVKSIFPKALYFCDPVMGDNGAIYVNSQIPFQLIDKLIPIADYLMPNHFEFNLITGRSNKTYEDLTKNSDKLFSKNLKGILLTSFQNNHSLSSQIETVYIDQARAFSCSAAKFERSFTGSGDTISALFASHILNNKSPQDSLELSASSLHFILEKTFLEGRGELMLTHSHRELLSPSIRFKAVELN